MSGGIVGTVAVVSAAVRMAAVLVTAVAGRIVGAVLGVRLGVVGAVAATHFLDRVIRPVLGLRHAGPAERQGGDAGEDCDPSCDGSHCFLLRVDFQPRRQCRETSVEVSIGPWSYDSRSVSGSVNLAP
jgi:hypothetical protein